MTGGPPAGPASAHPTFSRPALTCFSGANELFAPPEGASAAPARGKSTAAMVMAVAANMRRRLWLTVSVMDVSPCKVRPIAHLFLGLDRRERVLMVRPSTAEVIAAAGWPYPSPWSKSQA